MSPRTKVSEAVLDRGGYCLRPQCQTLDDVHDCCVEVVVQPGPADDPHSGLTHLDLPEALHESPVCAATHRCRYDVGPASATDAPELPHVQSSTQPIGALRRRLQDATDDEDDHDGQDKQMSDDERYDHLALTTAALPTWDSHLNRIDYQPHLVATTSDQPDPLKSESKAEVTDAFIVRARVPRPLVEELWVLIRYRCQSGQLTNRDDDDDDDDDDVGDKPRKRRRTDISLAVSDTEGTEDNTFQVMHSKPQYSTPRFDGPSNPPNAASGQDGLSVSAATISARLDRVEIQLAQLVDVLTVPSLDNIKSDVGSAAKIFVSTPFFCKHHGAAPMFAVESDVKHRAFYKVLMRHLPSALMQVRSELEDHIKRAQGDPSLLGTTMKSWYKNLEVTITEHVCWWRVLWQAVKQPDRKATVEADLTGNKSHRTAHVPGSRSNSFAEKVNRLSSTLAEIVVDAYLEDEYKHGREFDHQRFLTDQLAPVMPHHGGIRTSQPGRRQNLRQTSCLEVVENLKTPITRSALPRWR
ncbi:BQ5605_C003g02022 [Microbotryum silenes-dioicae]|uniref:BQ5605_C003g02022 protein n=1 Tax=Microbotryum silenes-dioicae TaxID=796604 RepID=A0A2X0M4S8_9BASI|nr:BQ5605_C003g02022 [Microbotryum silenes-dioicae]